MPSSPRRIAPTNLTRHPRGNGTATPEGSATQTITSTPLRPDGLVLRLRGAHSPVSAEHSASASASDTEGATSTRRRIHWAEDVIDNEGLGRKKSKVCCIFHKNREVGESSDEDDSSSSSDSDGDNGSGESDDGGARMAGGKRGRRKGKGNGKGREHRHGKDCDHGHDGERRPSPNAYERMPKYDVKPLEKQPGH